MIEDAVLIQRARQVVNPRRLSANAEAGSVGSALVTEQGNVYMGRSIGRTLKHFLSTSSQRTPMRATMCDWPSHYSSSEPRLGDGNMLGARCAFAELEQQEPRGNVFDERPLPDRLLVDAGQRGQQRTARLAQT
jgi:hypothetical protein